MAAILAGRAHLFYLPDLSQRASACPPGGNEEILYALPGRRHGQPALGGAFYWLTELEPPATSNRVQEPCHLYLWRRNLRTAGDRKAYLQKGEPIKAPDGAEIMSWIYGHDNPYYPKDHKPLVRAWDIDTGNEVWTVDFSQFGCGGNDAGLCLMDDTLYYSCFFGYAAKTKEGSPGAKGLTAAIEPATGRVIWLTTQYYVTAGTTISAENGRLYLGGYNPPNEKTQNRYVWCLDAKDGSLIWQSEPVAKAVNVITVGKNFLFAHASSGKPSYLIDKATGKILSIFDYGYACTRFTLSEPTCSVPTWI